MRATLAATALAILNSQNAAGDYRAVVLPFPFAADLEARDISHDGFIVGMMEPLTNEIPPNTVLWSPSPESPEEYSAQVYRMASASGGTPFSNGVGVGIDGETDKIVGYLWLGPSPSTQHAFYQTGTTSHLGDQAIVWKDLAPPSATGSTALASHNGVVAGVIRRISTTHIEAALWDGNPSSVSAANHVSLHPVGWHHSIARDTNRFTHVGGGGAIANDNHALVWNGTSSSAVNLNPLGYTSSDALAIDLFGNRIAGWAEVPSGPGATERHAMIWNNSRTGHSANTALDIHPTDFESSEATAVAPGVVAGFGQGRRTNNLDRAMFWRTGGPGSEVDLHQFLPPGFIASECTAVNHGGTIVGTAFKSRGERSAIAWVPVDDFFIQHDKPVLYVIGGGSFQASGSVVFRNRVQQATQVKVQAGVSSQIVAIPAGQSEGRFNLRLLTARQSSTFQISFIGTHGSAKRRATLTVVAQQPFIPRRPFP